MQLFTLLFTHQARFIEQLVQPASLLIYLFIMASTKLAFVFWNHLKSIDKMMAQQSLNTLYDYCYRTIVLLLDLFYAVVFIISFSLFVDAHLYVRAVFCQMYEEESVCFKCFLGLVSIIFKRQSVN